MNIEEIKQAIDNAPYGDKRRIVKRYADALGKSEKTIYRVLADTYGKKRVRTVRPKAIDNNYIHTIAALKAQSMSYGSKERELRTEDAIEIAELKGLVPVGVLKKSTVDRRLRENGFRDAKPVVSYQEEFCNQAHYVDFSRSEYISIAGFDRESDSYILKMNGKSLRYKNKEGQAFSLWLAGLRDGKSGVRLVRYYTVTGENIYMGLDFLQWCWSREKDNHPLNYVPHNLRIDNGALSKKKEVVKALEALDVKICKSEAYNKKAMGKIERTWRTFWQRFELKLLMEVGEGKTFLLDELNELAFQYCVNEMEDKHPNFTADKKRVIYERDLLAYAPRTYDGDIKNIASWPHRRKVRADLSFSIDNTLYKAPERYLGKYILVHRNLNGELVGEGEHDGLAFAVVPFKPQPFGEFKSFPDTYRERMQKDYIRLSNAESDSHPSTGLRMTPKEKPIIVDSVHEKTEDGVPLLMNPDDARLYIARELSLDTYEEVSRLFDPLLAVSTKKEDIDAALKPLKQQAV